MQDQQNLSDIAAAVRQRAGDLVSEDFAPNEVKPEFVLGCLRDEEQGDGRLFAAMHGERFLYNTSPDEGQWLVWNGVTWEEDRLRRSWLAALDCADAYRAEAEKLSEQISDEGIVKSKKDPHPDEWKIDRYKEFHSRDKRIRRENGVKQALKWAPVVHPRLACEDADFDQRPMMLPVANGVIDLTTGVLTRGRPEDRLMRRLDIEYDPRADYGPWPDVFAEITADKAVGDCLHRSFGYGITGNSHEQFIWWFLGRGRNGKGVIFDLIGDVMGPYYHDIHRSMLVETKMEQSPNATSEHLYSLLAKRIIVGAETNKGQKIDGAAIKELTGQDRVKCRPLFRGEVRFFPTHSLFVHTNHLPSGLTSDLAMLMRVLIFDFPLIFVDDVDAEKRRFPALADKMRKKDPMLKDKLRACRKGILRWLVEGCLEWQSQGINPPPAVRASVDKLAKEEDWVGEFLDDCIREDTYGKNPRVSLSRIEDVFSWWWAENKDAREQRRPAVKTLAKEMRDRMYLIDKSGGKTWVYNVMINPEIVLDVDDFCAKRSRKS